LNVWTKGKEKGFMSKTHQKPGRGGNKGGVCYKQQGTNENLMHIRMTNISRAETEKGRKKTSNHVVRKWSQLAMFGEE